MATTIKLKNGSGAPATSDLVQGEPAIDLTNRRLYTENASGAIIEVGSNPSSLSIAGTAVTATAAELNILDGVTSTAAELNILDGVTSTAAELNILDGVTSTTAELNILDGVTSTTAELNILDGVTSTATELNILDGVTSSTAELNILDGVTSTTAELNILDGVTSTTAELNILDGVTSTTAELNILDGKAFLDEDNMASNSATGIPSQQSVKAYVDANAGGSGGISNVVEDTTPQLGGSLDVNGNAIVSVSNGNIALTPNGSGLVRLDGNVDIQSGEIVLKNAGSVSNVKFYCESSNAHYTQLQSSAHSAYSGNVTLTLPASTDTLVGKATTDTLTNKTLTSPDINTPDIDGGTIDGTVIGGSTAAAGTFTTFTSNGIDDNADAVAITIDSSENVGIGTTSPANNLHIHTDAGDEGILIKSTGNTSNAIVVDANRSSAGAAINNLQGKWNGTAVADMLFLTGSDTTNKDDGVITFRTSSADNLTERVRIDSSGNVGIGNTGSSTIRLGITGSHSDSTNHAIQVMDSSSNIMFNVRNDGLMNFGLRTNSPYNFTTSNAVNAYLNSSGGLQRSTSSRRYKSDITDMPYGLSDVMNLRPVTFEGINDADGRRFAGFIAEEVHDAGLTEFVDYNTEDEPDALAYGNMVALLTKAVQDQQAMIETLQAEVAALKGA